MHVCLVALPLLMGFALAVGCGVGWFARADHLTAPERQQVDDALQTWAAEALLVGLHRMARAPYPFPTEKPPCSAP